MLRAQQVLHADLSYFLVLAGSESELASYALCKAHGQLDFTASLCILVVRVCWLRAARLPGVAGCRMPVAEA